MKTNCTVVIPCLNEAQTLAHAIDLAKQLLASLDGEGEIIVADNGSTDASIAIAEAAGARVVPVRDKGYGFALMAGITAAKGDIVVMGDADATYDFREAKTLVEAVANGADLAMGSRLRGHIEKGAMPFLHRYLGTPVLTALIRFFFHAPISDCNCGMRAFSKTAFQKMDLSSGGMEFASEMVIKAAIAGLRIVEFPISLAKDKRDRAPHLHTWRDGWRHLRFILLFAPHILFTLPGHLLAWASGAALALLAIGPVTIGQAHFDYHHMFYLIPFFCVGVQLLWFSHISNRFRAFTGLEAAPTHPFHLEGWLLTGFTSCLASVAIFATVLVKWLAAGRTNLLAIRPCCVALILFLFGMLTIPNALLTSMFELRFIRKPTP